MLQAFQLPSLLALTPEDHFNLIDNINNFTYKIIYAGVVKLVDALDSKSSGPCVRASSILASGTRKIRGLPDWQAPFLVGLIYTAIPK